MARTSEERRREQKRLLAESDRIYDLYVKPLEAEHWGEYVAVTKDGRTVLGADREDVSRSGRERFGSGNFLFRVGPRVTNRWV